jgi:hypothetical protein
MRLPSLAAFSNALMSVIDGTAPRNAPFAIAPQFAPLDLPADTSLTLSPLVACHNQLALFLIQYPSEVSWIGCDLPSGATIQPSLNDAFTTGSSGNILQWT